MLSPFFTILARPRQTIRRIVDADPTQHTILLVGASGAMVGLTVVLGRDLRTLPLFTILAICVIIGPLVNLLFWYLFGAVVRWTGSWLGGKATTQEVRAATAWSYVPSLFAWILTMLVSVVAWAGKSVPLVLSLYVRVLSTTILGYPVLATVLHVWTTIIELACLAEVHRFSVWRAWGALILGGVLIAAPFAGLAAALLLAR